MSGEMTDAGLMYRVWGAGAGRVSSVLLERDMAARVAVVVWYVESKGGTLHLTEGQRPIGVPADQYVTDERKTSTGGSNQWFQVGRMNRGLTPSAIVPPAKSRHWSGRALDSNAPTARDMTLRAEGYYLSGLVRNVPSESWHAEPLEVTRVDLAPWIEKVTGASKPAPAPKPEPEPGPERSTIRLITTRPTVESTARSTYLVTEAGRTHVMHPTHVRTLEAWLGGQDDMLESQAALIDFYVQRAGLAQLDPRWADLTRKIDELAEATT